jgi:hypothetical protein
MRAFHNNAAIKSFYLDRIRAHAAADEIQKGFYWEAGRGCAVGCTVHGDDHAAYETELGIPMWLALLEDKIFEGLPIEEAKRWPERFLSAITVGQDLKGIKKPFLQFVVAEARSSAATAAARATSALAEAAAATKAATKAAARTAARAAEAKAAARAAAWAARAARAAAAQAADAAAWSAARAAAWSAATAARAEAEADTEANAANAVEALAEAAVWPSLAEAAQAEAYSYFADKLIELIEQAGNTKEKQS